MRTFHWNAPIIIGAGAALVSLFVPAPPYPKAEEQTPVALAKADAADAAGAALADLRAKLDGSDRALAVQALGLALNELGDGATLVWRRPARGLVGKIKPSEAFRDDGGRVCRHVTYSLTLGQYVRQVEGIACREANGRWSLAG